MPKLSLTRRQGLTGLAAATIGLPPLEAFAAAKNEATLATVNAAAFLMVRMESLFATKVAEKTNGDVAIKVVTDGQLGGQRENIEAVMAGNLEMCQFNNAVLGSFYPNTMLFDLPFLFRDIDHMRKVVNGPIGQKVYAEFQSKTGIMILIAGMADGPRSVWNSRRPVRTPADLKGMKLRVMEGPIMVDTFRDLGAIPTPMAYPEVYMAAKQGVIDGAETPPNGLIEGKVPEVAKYYSLTRHFSIPSGVAANAKWFASLPEADQAGIRAAAVEALAWYNNAYDADNQKALAEAQKDGMQINDVTDMAQFRTAVQPVYRKYADRVGGMALIQTVIDTK